MHQAARRRLDACAKPQRKSAINSRIGIGIPRNHSSKYFMRLLLDDRSGYRSRRRPPQVANKLAQKAPSNSVMNSQSAA